MEKKFKYTCGDGGSECKKTRECSIKVKVVIEEEPKFKKGDLVTNKEFGHGVVIKNTGEFGYPAILVEFENASGVLHAKDGGTSNKRWYFGGDGQEITSPYGGVEKRIPKVGDIIRIKRFEGGDVQKGEFFEITGDDGTNFWLKGGWLCHKDNFTQIISKEPVKPVVTEKKVPIVNTTEGFVVGDIITGKEPNRYTITTSDMIGEVVSINGKDRISVKVLTHKSRPEKVGIEYQVESGQFVKTSLPKVDPVATFNVGDRVTTKKWGNGTIYHNADGFLSVCFDKPDVHLHDGGGHKKDSCWHFDPTGKASSGSEMVILSKIYEPVSITFTIKPDGFKVGEIITGKKTAPYSITTSDMVGEILEIRTDGDIIVKVISHSKFPSEKDNVFCVNPKHFVLYNPLISSKSKRFSAKETSDGRVRISRKEYDAICMRLDQIKEHTKDVYIDAKAIEIGAILGR